ncbi:MAG: S41 family peptidase [Alphaproteobacteria bacterium]
MLRKFYKNTLLLTVLFTIGSSALWLPDAKAALNTEETYRQLNLFGDVFDRVRKFYVEEVEDKELIENAINGMLTSLDPHSSYLNKKSFDDMKMQTRGKFGGLGIEVTMENGLVKVVSPIDDTPAFRAGIKSGDLITHIDEKPIMGMTLNDAVDKMRGKPGTDIILTIRREEVEPFDVTIERDVIVIKSVRWHIEGDDIGYIRITTFNEQTDTGIKKAMREFRRKIKKSKRKGFVLDLRNNPGGLLDQAVAVSDAFLDKGEIVSTRGRQAHDGQRFNARKGDLAESMPIVILINEGSASASEIVAGALQDHHRAIILGTKSFGKGSVQTIIPVANDGAMRLTTARYYTPSGRSIQGEGIEPDIAVEPAKVEVIDKKKIVRESDLDGALKNTNGASYKKKKVTKKKKDKDGKEKEQDYQLERAIDLLRGISLYQENAQNGDKVQSK